MNWNNRHIGSGSWPVLLVVLCSFFTAGFVPGATPARATEIAVHETNFPGLPRYKQTQTADALVQAGVQSMRLFMFWNTIEPNPGAFNWSRWDQTLALLEGRGITPLVCVYTAPAWAKPAGSAINALPDPQAFRAFFTAAVSRYAGRVPTWEVWNEPDLNSYARDLKYVDLLGVAREVVDEYDPAAQLMLGSLCGDPVLGLDIGYTLAHYYQLGAGPLMDIVSFQFYPATFDAAGADAFHQRIEIVRQVMAAANDGAKPLIVGEAGLHLIPTPEEEAAGQAKAEYLHATYPGMSLNTLKYAYWGEIWGGREAQIVAYMDYFFPLVAAEGVPVCHWAQGTWLLLDWSWLMFTKPNGQLYLASSYWAVARANGAAP